MQRYALLGWPVKHSVSPQMQGAGFHALGIDATYELIEVHPDDVRTCVQRLREGGYRGWNVTVPHKEQMAALVDHIDDDALAANSVNTVVNRDGKLHGYSTDGYGIATALNESFGLDVARTRVFFLGAGGAARAVAVYLARRGATSLVVTNRTLRKAEMLRDRILQHAPDCAAKAVKLSDTEGVREALLQVDVVIQATSCGLHPGDPIPMPPDELPRGLPVMDMIYGDTPFLRGAAERGCPVADGRGMLLYQGVRSFEIWTGRPAPVEAMRNGLQNALENRP